MGFRSRRTIIVPLLIALHKALCIAWARQHSHWIVDDWKHVAWSDECRFHLYRADGRVRQDNATPHTSRFATEWLQEYISDIRHFHRPSKSPDMNVIKHIWYALQHTVQKRSPPPLSPMDL
ncbi:hypothetical protein AVEN_83932-1 [Araneus ventricosus]|uniref:Uncharacterized protein n=1 Tax=Araneus ventricosus TaxID=182803 RepID=A0A4Y2QMT0_ARAVE|nr:hypothetical protein AVEN_211081-1 [Araneus ventricosus]GBN64580.1 hypothetical protein AVEN_83932-1 [Araneus ventricosus]